MGINLFSEFEFLDRSQAEPGVLHDDVEDEDNHQKEYNHLN